MDKKPTPNSQHHQTGRQQGSDLREVSYRERNPIIPPSLKQRNARITAIIQAEIFCDSTSIDVYVATRKTPDAAA